MTTLSISGVATRPCVRTLNLLKAVTAMIEAFHEALEMRRAAHGRYPFIEE